MICQDCKKNEATVHLTQIINNEKLVLSLCKDCAAERGFHSPLDNIPFPLAEMLTGFVHQQFPREVKHAEPDLQCDFCGLTFEQFAQQGRFGCGECYNAFRDRLGHIMRKIHGSSLHKGKLPITAKDDKLPLMEEERLENELRKAIEAEDFERAADLRDKLRTLKETQPVGEG